MKRNQRRPQLFFSADTGSGGGDGTPPASASASADAAPDGTKQDDDPTKSGAAGTYSEEDISALKASFEQQLLEARTQAAEEAMKKAQMKPEEKAEYEQQQRLANLEKREHEAAARELRLDAMNLLSDKQLDKDFLDYVLGADRDTTAKRIDTFKNLFDKAVQSQVESRLTGKTPPAGGSAETPDTVRDQFKRAMGGY